MKRTATQPTFSQNKNSNSQGFGNSMKQGFGLGVGLEGARAAIGTIGGMFSNKSEEPSNETVKNNEHYEHNEHNQTVETQDKCMFEKTQFNKCLLNYHTFVGNCDDYYEIYKRCSDKENNNNM